MSLKHRIRAAARILFTGAPTGFDITIMAAGADTLTTMLVGGHYYGNTLIVTGDDASVTIAHCNFHAPVAIQKKSVWKEAATRGEAPESESPPETEGGEGSDMEAAKAARLAELESEVKSDD